MTGGNIRMIDIGGRIKDIRETAKMDGKELAERIGVSPSYLSLLENNKRPCSIERLHSICEALGVTLRYFFATKDNENISEDLMLLEEIKANRQLAQLIGIVRYMTKENLRLIIALCESMCENIK
jgi:transcriptional regulator with XRE-family HTH domain